MSLPELATAKHPGDVVESTDTQSENDRLLDVVDRYHVLGTEILQQRDELRKLVGHLQQRIASLQQDIVAGQSAQPGNAAHDSLDQRLHAMHASLLDQFAFLQSRLEDLAPGFTSLQHGTSDLRRQVNELGVGQAALARGIAENATLTARTHPGPLIEQIAGLQEKLDHTEPRTQQLQRDLDESRLRGRKASQRAAELEPTLARLDAAQRDMAALQEQKHGLGARVQQQQAEIDASLRREAASTAQAAQLTAVSTRLAVAQRSLETAKAKVGDLEDQNAALKAELEKRRASGELDAQSSAPSRGSAKNPRPQHKSVAVIQDLKDRLVLAEAAAQAAAEREAMAVAANTKIEADANAARQDKAQTDAELDAALDKILEARRDIASLNLTRREEQYDVADARIYMTIADGNFNQFCSELKALSTTSNYDALLASALVKSAELNRRDMVKHLLAQGAPLTEGFPNGSIPLMWASARGAVAAIAEMLEFADDTVRRDMINHVDEQGDTALTIAAAEGHEDVVALLVDNGAGVSIANKQGRSPLTLALLRSKNYVAAARLFAAKAKIELSEDQLSDVLPSVETLASNLLDLAEELRVADGIEPTQAAPGT